jgi:cytochrome c peroxidase
MACVVALLAGLMIAAPGILFGGDGVDGQLTAQLDWFGFTGRIDSTLARRLGRPVDQPLANIGRLLWFDTITGLNGDNTCAGCHSPTRRSVPRRPVSSSRATTTRSAPR